MRYRISRCCWDTNSTQRSALRSKERLAFPPEPITTPNEVRIWRYGHRRFALVGGDAIVELWLSEEGIGPIWKMREWDG